MHEEADPLEAKAEEKGEEALGHKGEEPSVREDAYPLEAEAEENAEEAFEQRRELNALRHKMHKAVEEEDFETAIELRDMIRKMENKYSFCSFIYRNGAGFYPLRFFKTTRSAAPDD